MTKPNIPYWQNILSPFSCNELDEKTYSFIVDLVKNKGWSVRTSCSWQNISMRQFNQMADKKNPELVSQLGYKKGYE